MSYSRASEVQQSVLHTPEDLSLIAITHVKMAGCDSACNPNTGKPETRQIPQASGQPD